jgi:hypothetical protein
MPWLYELELDDEGWVSLDDTPGVPIGPTPAWTVY